MCSLLITVLTRVRMRWRGISGRSDAGAPAEQWLVPLSCSLSTIVLLGTQRDESSKRGVRRSSWCKSCEQRGLVMPGVGLEPTRP